jgi:hypothetical protein
MPRGASPKRERQYKKIEQKLEKEGAIQRKGRRGSGPDRKQTAGKVGRDEREPLELRMLFAICYLLFHPADLPACVVPESLDLQVPLNPRPLFRGFRPER